MQDFLRIDTVEDLKPFVNDKGFMEVILRDKKKKYRKFQKVVFNLASQEEQKELLQNAINLMNKNNDIVEKTLDAVENISKLQKLSIVLGCANLCATCVGFAIINA